MRIVWVLAVLASLSTACGGGKKNDPAAGGSRVGNDFTAQFKELTLRYNIADTTLERAVPGEKPLAVTGSKWFPDSLVKSSFAPGAKISYYPIGKIQNDDNELYVIVKGVAGSKKAAFLLCFDGNNVYKDGLRLCRTDDDPSTYFSASIDKSFNIKVVEETRTSPEDVNISDKTMAYNGGRLMVVVNNDPGQELAIINPIDTLPQTKKYSGDYEFDDKNMVSIRDGRDSTEFLFFYHFRKGSDDCEGEIKGKGTITGPNTARFMQDGDPCVLNFVFTATQVTVKEDHGCGNYRSMECKLDGQYTKKKKAAAPAAGSKAKEQPAKKPAPVKPATPKPPVKHTPVKNTNTH